MHHFGHSAFLPHLARGAVVATSDRVGPYELGGNSVDLLTPDPKVCLPEVGNQFLPPAGDAIPFEEDASLAASKYISVLWPEIVTHLGSLPKLSVNGLC